MLKFTFTALDEPKPYEKKFSSIEDYERSWGQVSHDMLNGHIVTNDGINTISCANDETKNALIAHFDKIAIEEKFNNSFFHLSGMHELLNIDKDTSRKLFLMLNNFKETGPVEHVTGNIFIIDPSNHEHKALLKRICPNQSVLQQVLQPMGSYYLKDTFVVEDGYNNNILVIDTRGEAQSIHDILPRSIEKGEVLIIDESDENYYCYNQVSGDPRLLTLCVERIKDKYKNTNLIVETSGFNNNKSNPANYYSKGQILKQGEPITVIPKNDDSNNLTTLYKVTPATCLAAGAKGKDLYINGLDNKGQVQHFTQGQYVDINDMSVYSANDIAKDFHIQATEDQNEFSPF